MVYYIGNTLTIYNDVDTCTLDDAYEYLKNIKEIGLDIETTQKYNGIYPHEGLDPYTSNIVMVQMGDLHNQFIIDYRHTKSLGKLVTLLESDKYLKIGHNLKFEYKHIFHNEGIRLNNLYDTMIVEQILYNGLPRKYGLKDLVKEYLSLEIDKDIRYDFLHIGSRNFTNSEIDYGAKDIIYPLKIKELQQPRIFLYDLSGCIRLEMLFISVLGDIELKGLNLDTDAWRNIYFENSKNLQLLKVQLDTFVLKNTKNPKFIDTQLDLFDDTLKCNVNWASPQQVIDLFKEFNIKAKEVSKTTKKLSYTVNATILKNYLSASTHLKTDTITFVETYLLYKEVEQRCTTFGIDFFKHINHITGRVHSNYRQILSTGRISSGDPNLQNIPSSDSFRRAFNVKGDRLMVNADYSGQEQIILANKSLEPNLLEFYDKNLGDMHSYVASKLFKVSFDDIKAALGVNLTAKSAELLKYRQLAKGAGFAINYGGNGHTIAKNLRVSEAAGEQLYQNYFKEFSQLATYFKKVQKRALTNGYILIDNVTKRKCFIDKQILRNPKEIKSVERMALNYPVQGEAGSITKLAAIYLRRSFLELNVDAQIVNLVHDEINVECHKDVSSQVKFLMESSMKRSADLWCKRVKLKAVAKISDHWSH